MAVIVLRGGVEIESPLEPALEFLTAYSSLETPSPSGSASLDERDLRLANRAGARISAVEIHTILERRSEIVRVLRKIPPTASLTSPASSIPWASLEQLFDAFADIRGVGLSKVTKTLHRKRPALIPMLDSVVQGYLAREDPASRAKQRFGQHAIALVRSYKLDLDRNRAGLQRLQQELAAHGYRLTEVRILDLLIWSLSAGR